MMAGGAIVDGKRWPSQDEGGGASAMRFGLLGTMQVMREDGTEVVVRAPKERVVLAALLVSARQIVSASTLIDIVWEDRPPATAKAALLNMVMRLRMALGIEAGLLRTRQPGYVLDVPDQSIDVREFRARYNAGAVLWRARQWESAAVTLRAALDLWRGRPLQDVPARWLVEQEGVRLQDEWLQATYWRIEADIQLGRSDDVIGELRLLIAGHHHREQFAGQLMTAYHRLGRTADALAVFRRLRTALAADLGIEPSAPLQHLHREVLRGPMLSTR
jgi:DNA-binding SARP family transcriptional activator